MKLEEKEGRTVTGYLSDNPVWDAERYARRQDRWLEHLPVCCECGEAIQTDHYYVINSEAICPDCLEGYRRELEDRWEEG